MWLCSVVLGARNSSLNDVHLYLDDGHFSQGIYDKFKIETTVPDVGPKLEKVSDEHL